MTTATITARTLGEMPTLVERECGEAALHRVFARAGLPLHLLEERDFYIPQAALKSFVEGASHALGGQDIGLVAAPHLSVMDYGRWGDYVLGGETLGVALERALETVHLHASADWLAVAPSANEILFGYRFADAGGRGYDDIAFVAAAVMLSIPRAYLGARWSPRWLELDIDVRKDRQSIERTFGCEARLGRGCVAVPIPREALDTPRRSSRPHKTVTLDDVIMERGWHPPRMLVDLVREQIRMRLADGQPKLETVAQAIDLGPRTLQRRLAAGGISFRDLATMVKIDRARELLAEPGMSVTQVANELSFSTPANFTRAFSARTGQSPSRYRPDLARR